MYAWIEPVVKLTSPGAIKSARSWQAAKLSPPIATTTDGRTLKLYDMQTKAWADIAQGSVNDVVWSPDGESLFFDTNPGTEAALYRFSLSDKKLEIWASLKNVRRAGFFAPWLGMSPDGAPLILEDASIQEVYSVAVNLP